MAQWDTYEQLCSALAETRQAGRMPYRPLLRIGFTSNLGGDLCTRLSAAFARQAPECRLVSTTLTGIDQLRWLHTGQITVDVLVGWFPDPHTAPQVVPERVTLGPVLGRSPRAILVGRRHRLAKRSSVDAEELAEVILLRPWGFGPFADAWTPATTPAGKPIHRAQQARPTYLEDLPDLLADGRLAHLMMSSFGAFDDLLVIPVNGLLPLACTLAWPRAADNPWIVRFAALAAAEYANV